MPRRAPASKRRRVPAQRDWNGWVPEPWLSMKKADEDELRVAYLASRDFAGEPPIARVGETVWACRARTGFWHGFPLWAAARCDPDPKVRRLALIAGVDAYRRRLRRAIANGEKPGSGDDIVEGPPIGGFRSDGLLTTARRADALRRGGRAEEAFADLVAAVAPLGLEVTKTQVKDVKNRATTKRRSGTKQRAAAR